MGSSLAFHFLRDGVMVTSGLVPVHNKTRGDSEFSLGRVSMAGEIGDMGQSWEIQSMRGVGFGLERYDVSRTSNKGQWEW